MRSLEHFNPLKPLRHVGGRRIELADAVPGCGVEVELYTTMHKSLRSLRKFSVLRTSGRNPFNAEDAKIAEQRSVFFLLTVMAQSGLSLRTFPLRRRASAASAVLSVLCVESRR